jgi:hypothetical protein
VEPAAAGTYDVAFNVSNPGTLDAGPFSVGIFVDPPGDPFVGLMPQGVAAIGGLAAGGSTQGTVNVTADVWSRVLGLVDVYGEVIESNEGDNVGRLAPYVEGSPVVTPDPVELTGGITVTVPVNFSARSLQVELGGAWGEPTWWLGETGGNYEGQGEISGTFSIPADAGLIGTRMVIVTVWDDGHNIGRSYVYDPAMSIDFYSIYNAGTGAPLSVSTFPLTTLSVVDATHPNLTLAIGMITESSTPGFVTVPYTVSNPTAFDAGASTLGIYVDPANTPVVGDLPTATTEIAPLPAGASASGTVDVEATLVDRIVGLADALGAVVETNEWDNAGSPPPALIGQIVATPEIVDEGSLLTVTLPVSGATFHAEVYLGDDMDMSPPLRLGYLDGNWENQGFITGTLLIPPGTAGWVPSIWVILRDDGSRIAGYGASSSVSLTNLAMTDDPLGAVWSDSGIPLTFIQIIPWSRPNLQVSIDQVDDLGGSFNVTYTVVNAGATDANGFDVGFYVDPPSLPGVGSPTQGLITGLSLGAGGTYTSTVNLAATGTPAIFAFVDAGGVIEEQSESDNLAWKLPAAAMTGSPVPSVTSVAEGGSLDVTVPVSGIVRSIDVYVGAGDMMGGGPAFKIGTATGNGAGEGTIVANCTLPAGSAGAWYIWVATFDLYGLEWRGYGSELAMSTEYYTEWVEVAGELRPTTIPLTTLTVTP